MTSEREVSETTYIPRDGDLIYSVDPEDPKAIPEVALVVREATKEDKIKYVLRAQTFLSPGEELDKKELRTFFKAQDRYLCIAKEKVKIIQRTWMRGKVTEAPESAEELQSGLPGDESAP